MQACHPVATCHDCSPTTSSPPARPQTQQAWQPPRAGSAGLLCPGEREVWFHMGKEAPSITHPHICTQTSAFYSGFRNKNTCLVRSHNPPKAT